MSLKTLGAGFAATAALTAGMAAVSPAHAASLYAGQFTITAENASRITRADDTPFASGNLNLATGNQFRLNLDTQALGLTDRQGVFAGSVSAGTSGLTGTPNVVTLLLTVLGPNTFSFANTPNFITGLFQNGKAVALDLTGGTLGGFVTTRANYSFGGNLAGILRYVDNSELVSAGTSIASFHIGSGPGSNRSSITVKTIPTPALLPGLVGFGIAALRKRKREATAQVEA